MEEKIYNKEIDEIATKDKEHLDSSLIPLIRKGLSENVIDNIYEANCFNKYTILVVLSIGAFLIVDGMEMCFMNLLIIPIKVYFDLTEFELQCLASMIFVGSAIGGFISGYMTQYIGRVYSLMINMLLLLVSHIIMAISDKFWMFLFFRILIGVALGVSKPILLNNLSEYLPINIRGFMLVFIWFFFQIGIILLGSTCFVAMPNLEVSQLKNVMMFLSIFPLLSLAINMFCFYESPRSLIVNHKEKKALEILSHIKGRQLTQYESDKIIDQVLNQGNDTTSGFLSDLFNKDYVYLTCLNIALLLIGTTLFYGLYIISTLTMQQIGVENGALSNKEIIIAQLIIAGSNIFSFILTGILCEVKHIGRKGCAWGSFIFAAIFAIPCVYFPKLYSILFSIYMFFTNTAGNALITYIIEIYPTKLRDISSGFLFFTKRVSGLISQFLMIGLFKIHYSIPYYLATALAITGIVLTLLLPHDTINQPLDKKYDLTHKTKQDKDKDEIDIISPFQPEEDDQQRNLNFQ